MGFFSSFILATKWILLLAQDAYTLTTAVVESFIYIQLGWCSEPFSCHESLHLRTHCRSFFINRVCPINFSVILFLFSSLLTMYTTFMIVAILGSLSTVLTVPTSGNGNPTICQLNADCNELTGYFYVYGFSAFWSGITFYPHDVIKQGSNIRETDEYVFLEDLYSPFLKLELTPLPDSTPSASCPVQSMAPL